MDMNGLVILHSHFSYGWHNELQKLHDPLSFDITAMTNTCNDLSFDNFSLMVDRVPNVDGALNFQFLGFLGILLVFG